MSEGRKGFTRLNLFTCLLGGLVVGFALAILAVVLGRGSFGHFLVAVPLLFFAPPLFLFSLLCGAAALIRRKRRGPALAWLSALSGTISILLLCVGLSVIPGAVLNCWDLREARFFCESIVPAIENHRANTGAYPVNLSELGIEDDDLPSILAGGRLTYFADGDYYQFSFMDPGGMLTGYEYDSESRAWQRWD